MSAATLVLAPGLFSTMTDCLNSLPRKSATLRPRMSVAPPAANGMISRIGRSGYSAAAPDGSNAAAQTIPTNCAAIRERLTRPFMSPPKRLPASKSCMNGRQAQSLLRRHRAQVGDEGVEIVVGHVLVELEAHRRFQARAIAAHAIGDRTFDFRVGPRADPLF